MGREKGERDRHVDLADAALFACGDLLDIGHGAGNDFVEPAPGAGDGRDERGAGLRADGAGILRRSGFWHDDLTPPLRWCLSPGNNMENRTVGVLLAGFMVWWRPVFSSASLFVFRRLQFDRQLVGLDDDADDMSADEVAIIGWW